MSEDAREGALPPLPKSVRRTGRASNQPKKKAGPLDGHPHRRVGRDRAGSLLRHDAGRSRRGGDPRRPRQRIARRLAAGHHQGRAGTRPQVDRARPQERGRGGDLARRAGAASADGIGRGISVLGVMERLGLGPDELLADNPKLVYGRMTGWGQDGPLRAVRPGTTSTISRSPGRWRIIGRAGEKADSADQHGRRFRRRRA